MFNPLGTDSSTENELRAQSIPIKRMDKDANYLFRFVKLVTGFGLVFLPCMNKDGKIVNRAVRLGKGESIIDKICKADRELLTKYYPEKDARPSSILARKKRFFYLVFDRSDGNQLKILELNWTANNSLSSTVASTSNVNPGMLKYGPLYMYDITIKRTTAKTGGLTKTNYVVLPEASNYANKIPTESLSEKYPTIKMIKNYLLANIGEEEDQIPATKEEVTSYIQKYSDFILRSLRPMLSEKEEIIDESVDRYIQHEIYKFFTDSEIEQIEKFNLDNITFLHPHTDEEIINMLKETPLCLRGNDNWGNSFFKYPDELLENVAEEFQGYLTDGNVVAVKQIEHKTTIHVDEGDVEMPEKIEVEEVTLVQKLAPKPAAKTTNVPPKTGGRRPNFMNTPAKEELPAITTDDDLTF